MRNLLIIAVIMLLAFGLAFLLDHTDRPAAPPIQTPMADMQEVAPAVQFTDMMTGTRYALSDFKGRGIILNFWASWCAPCRIEMPQLFDIAARHKDDLTLILVSVDSDANSVTAFLRAQKLNAALNIIVVHDPRKAISKDVFGTIRYPESILIDRGGMMRQKIIGGVDWYDESVQASLNKILQTP